MNSLFICVWARLRLQLQPKQQQLLPPQQLPQLQPQQLQLPLPQLLQ